MKGLQRRRKPHRDGSHSWGWEARTQWKGVRRSAWFSDSEYGGQDNASDYAKMWIGWMNRELGKPETEKWVRSEGAWGHAGKSGKWNREAGPAGKGG